jgi:hypothetical protein
MCSALNTIASCDHHWFDIGEKGLGLRRKDMLRVKESTCDQEAHFVELCHRLDPHFSLKKLQGALTKLSEKQTMTTPPLRSKPRALRSNYIIVERDDLNEEIESLNDRFHKLIDLAKAQLESEKKEIADVYKTLQTLPPRLSQIYTPILKEKMSDLRDSQSYSDFFFELNANWSYIDIELLERIVERHGDDELKSAMKAYLADLHRFRRTTSVHQLVHVKGWEPTYKPFDKEKYKQYIARLERDPKTCSLQELEDLRKDTSFSIHDQPLSTAVLILHEITLCCVTVVWLVTAENVDVLLVSITELINSSNFIDRYGIDFLSLDGHIIYPMENVSQTIAFQLLYMCFCSTGMLVGMGTFRL